MKVITNFQYTLLFEDTKGRWQITVYKPSEFNAPFLFHQHHYDEKYNGNWDVLINPNSNSTYTDAFVIREAIRRIDTLNASDSEDKNDTQI
jgi:hypothetical protein